MSCIACKELIDFLDDYVAGELPAAREHELERHLSACRAWTMKSYRHTIHLARGAYPDPAEIPPELVAALLRSIA